MESYKHGIAQLVHLPTGKTKWISYMASKTEVIKKVTTCQASAEMALRDLLNI